MKVFDASGTPPRIAGRCYGGTSPSNLLICWENPSVRNESVTEKLVFLAPLLPQRGQIEELFVQRIAFAQRTLNAFELFIAEFKGCSRDAS